MILTYFIGFFFNMLGMMPRSVLKHMGNFIGRLWHALDKKRRDIVTRNLQWAFGNEKSIDEINAIRRKVFMNIGQIPFEIGWFMRLPQQHLKKYFQIKGLYYLSSIYHQKRGGLVLTAHLGNWELMPSLFGIRTGYLANVLYRPMDNAPLDAFFRQFRSRFGTRMIPRSHAMRKILKRLNNGELVGILFDQNVDWYEGVFVEFFNHIACTNKGLALLSMKTGAPVLPLFFRREGDRFIVEFGPEIPLIHTGDKIRDIETNTRRYNQVLESYIQKYPDQWFWVHRRWKTRPYCRWPAGDR